VRGLRTIRAAALISLAVAVAATVAAGWGHPAWWALPALGVATWLSEVAVVHLTFGRQRWLFSLTEGLLAAALVLAPGGWVTLAICAGVGVAQVLRHMPRLKVQFNVAQFAASTSLAVLVTDWALGFGLSSIAAACLGLLVFCAVNHLLVAVAVSATSRRPMRNLLLASAPLGLVHCAGNSSIGLLAAWLSLRAPLGLLGLLVPLALLWSAYDQETRRAAEARLFAELARGQEQATGRSIDLSAQVVLTAAARLFGGADVEMVLRHPDGALRYTGDEYGVPERQRVDSDAFGEPWVLRALGTRGVSTGSDDGRPYCAAVLGDPGRPLAVLVARRPRGAPAFGRREATLAHVLVGQAESWLNVADLTVRHDTAVGLATAYGDASRALGDLGAHTAPSLLVLRESTGRLSRLAQTLRGADPVSEIVEELYAVERAVASLLGAIALASEPDLTLAVAGVDAEANAGDLDGGAPASRASSPAGTRAGTDWTTTGVLPRPGERGGH